MLPIGCVYLYAETVGDSIAGDDEAGKGHGHRNNMSNTCVVVIQYPSTCAASESYISTLRRANLLTVGMIVRVRGVSEYFNAYCCCKSAFALYCVSGFVDNRCEIIC